MRLEMGESFWWLSFCDGSAPKFLGVCIIRACNIEEAISKSHALNIHPGGEILFAQVVRCGGEFDLLQAAENKLLNLSNAMELAKKIDSLVMH